MESLLTALTQADQSLFAAINQSAANPVFDSIMPIITDLHTFPAFWLALTAVIALLFYRKRSTTERELFLKQLSRLVLVAGLSMALADLVAYRAIKTFVQRPRPEAAGLTVTLRTHSHSGWSLPSNHASNMFALARSVQLLAPAATVPIYGMYVFASTVAFSRVYVGVHFPGDTLVGGTIGWLCASLVHFILRQFPARRKRRRTKSV